ncbi:ABC transporter substrate-binding protein [Acidaminococcus timonensis]|uniref:ABC transporter substrate-binding protein n=1 Tax=Acidaminococcus timonensis TaxID=1871002 RepID=UPI0008D8F98F|nr:ABC transporter substrate-binding protein [Acidaminococcus timonensis]
MMMMKKSMKWLATLALAAMVVGAAGCGSSTQTGSKDKKSYKVGVLQLVQHPALDAANKGFIDGLKSKGFEEGKNVTFDQQNAQGDQSNLQTIAQRFVSNKDDLVCAIATPAAQTMANASKEIPIVGTAITDYKVAKLVKDNSKPGTNVTGTTDMNPVEAQIDLLVKIMPKAKTVGFIYNSSEVNSQLQIDLAKKAAAARGLATVEATVSSVNDIQQAAQSLMGKVDALYIPTDNVMASAMPNLIKITDEAKIPVFCGEAGMLKSGGVATLGIDYYKLGFQTGEMAADILSGKAKPQDMAIQSQKTFTVSLNEEAIKKLGLTIPDDIRKEAKGAK